MRLAFEDCVLDLARFELSHRGQPVALEPRVLDLLVHLVERRERVVTKDELLDSVWSGETVTEGALTRAVKEARRAVGDDGVAQRVIRTVRGRGYRFVAEPIVSDSGARVDPHDLIVGYEAPLAALEQSLESVFGGRGRLLLIEGDPSIGKTRFARELVVRARARSAEVLEGRCVPGGGAPAFWPFTQICRSFFDDREPQALRELLGARAADLAEVLTDLHQRIPDLDVAHPVEPAEARFRFFDAVARFLERAARQVPLVIIIDDLHVSDLDSLELLRFLARELAGAPVLLACTYCGTELSAGASRMLGMLAREPSATTLTLPGFGIDDVRRFVEIHTGAVPDAQLARDLHERTGGNPYFLSQLIPILEERTARSGASDETGDSASAQLPQGVREAIRGQLDRLSPECRSLLSLASVMGREFSLPVLVVASAGDPVPSLALVEEATSARVVIPVAGANGRYRFSQALVGEVLYAALDAVERLRLHRSIGFAIEEHHRPNLDEHLDELAHHFLEIAPGGDVKAGIDYARRAAAQASAHFAWETAAKHLERAIEASTYGRQRPGQLGRLLLQAGWARRRSGNPTAARAAFQRAGALARSDGDAGALAEAALGLAAEEETGIVAPERIAALEDALDAIEAADSTLRVRLASRLAHALYFGREPTVRMDLSREAADMARRLGDPRALLHALLDFHFVLVGAADASERLAVAVEAKTLACTLGDAELEGRARILCIEDLLELGRIDDVDAEMAAVDRIARSLRIPSLAWHHVHHRAMRALHDGRLANAEAAASQGLALGLRHANDVAFQFYGIQIWMIRREQGRLGELQSEVRDLAARYPENTGWASALAYWDAAEGRNAEAERGLARLVDNDLAGIPRDLNWLVALSLLSEVCFMLGDAERGAALYDAIQGFEGKQVVIGLSMAVNGPVSRYLGLCAAARGDAEAAIMHLEAAEAVCDRLGARPMRGYTALDLARVLAGRGRREEARARAGTAVELASELGMSRLAADAHAFLEGA